LTEASYDDYVTIPKTATVIAAKLRGQILRGELREGDVLPTESELMERYRIARPTLREAFRILEAESLLSIRRGRAGAHVRKPRIEVAANYAGMVLQAEGATLADVADARLDIEPPCARRLATRSDPAAVQALERALELEHSAASKTSGDDYTKAAAHFHAEVVRLADNMTLGLFGAMIEEIMARSNELVRQETGSGPREHQAAHRAHTRLVELVKIGATVEAEALWRTHVQSLNDDWLKRLGANRIVDILDER
jgi:DNA-binding FadR family transcriptional regulator